MFEAIRSLAATVAKALFKTRAVTALRYTGPDIPVVTRRQRLALALCTQIDEHPRRYPELQCRRGKTKGRRDRSQQVRANRRKAAR